MEIVLTIVASSSEASLASLAACFDSFISFSIVSYADAALSVSAAGVLVWSKIDCKLAA